MATLAHHLDAEPDADWTFAVAAPDDVRPAGRSDRVLVRLGRRTLQQFDHPAMLAGIRDGRLVRLLVGGSVTSAPARRTGARSVRRVRAQLSAARPGAIPLRAVRCGHRTVELDWGFALLLVPVGVTGLTTAVMFVIGARVRRAADQRREGCGGFVATPARR